MIETVTKYNNSGLVCLPIKQDKTPYSSQSWHSGFKNASDYAGSYGIGIICGKKSGNLECIDIDNHFGDAREILTKFIDQIKDVYDKYLFPIESTMNGGYHMLYRCETNEGNLKLAQRPKTDENNKWKPDTIIETRGQGGYFVAAPTPGYKIIKNDILNIPKIDIEERNVLLSTARSFNEWSDIRKNEYEQGDKPGDVFNNDPEAINEVKSELLKAGWTEIREGYWCRPGKTKGISATLGKVGKNIFSVFSSNAYPFESGSLCKGYTPFQVISMLRFSGDFKAMAKDLAIRYDLNKRDHSIKVKKEPACNKTIDELDNILKASLIDTNIELERPPVALYISDIAGSQTIRKRLFTLGNFSAVIGKAKSRKTFLVSMLTSAMLKNDNIYNKFHGSLPNEKYRILYFDTEQGEYDAANNIKRIFKLAGSNVNQLGAFSLRPYSPIDRCALIEHALSTLTNVGLIVIDGIADLAKAINDEDEATRVTTLLLRWSKDYNCHIITVIHQNKNDNFATGHLGSSVMKKAEVVVSVCKERGSSSKSIVSCDYSRGLDFEDFAFEIINGIPALVDGYKEMDEVKYWND